MKLKKDFELSLWEDFMDNKTIAGISFINEQKIGVLANQLSNSPSSAYNINFKSKTDGTNELSFDINYRYWDNQEQDFVENPFRKYLYNEAKIKLNYKNKWFDFVIKGCQENSKEKKFTYTCKDLYIEELGRNGYSAEFSTSLGNNVGDVTELAAAALENSDWTVAPFESSPNKPANYTGPHSDMPIQKNEEVVFAYSAHGGFGYREINPDGSLGVEDSVPSGATIYVLYNSAKNEKLKGKDFQFYYDKKFDEKGKYEVDDDNFFINTNVKFPVSVERFQFTDDLFTFIPNYRGYRYVRAQQTKWLSKIGKRVTLYDRNKTLNNEYDWTHYSYVKTTYLSPEVAQNVLINSLPEVFDGTSGWRVWAKGKEQQIKIGGNCRYENNEVIFDTETYLQAYELADDGTTNDLSNVVYENLAFKHNLKNIGALTSGEVWVFRKPINKNYEITLPGIFIEIDSSELPCDSTPIIPLSDKYEYSFYRINQSKTYKELQNSDYSFKFEVTNGAFYGGEFFRFYVFEKEVIEDPLTGVITKTLEMITPESNITDQNLIKNEYYYFTEQAYDNCSSEEDLVIEIMESSEPEESSYCYYENFKKIGSIETKESNFFNIIQTLNEKFECWSKFEIAHNLDGSTMVDSEGKRIKQVVFKNYIGKDNYSGFKYGINLDSIQRTIDSQQITTKTIVKANTNEFAKNGTCNIARAQSNPSGAQAIYNFDYYCHQNILNAQEINFDLYVEKDGYLGYYTKLRRYNDELLELENQLIGVEKLIRDAEVKIQASNVGEEDFTEEILGINEKLAKNVIGYGDKTPNSFTASVPGDIKYAIDIFYENKDSSETYCGLKEWRYKSPISFYRLADEKTSEYEKYKPTNVIYNLNKGRELVDNYNHFIKQRDAATKIKREQEIIKAELIAHRDGKYSYVDVDGFFKEFIDSDAILPKIKALDKIFYSKYYRFIKEGTWTSQDYTDDELYYLDANSVSYTSAFPKVTYTISVFDIKNSIIPEELGYNYSNYDFECGDRTTIEDTEFFGWLPDGVTPYKEEIIVSETSEFLDKLDGDTITVQNYKTQFDDLFQRIAASTQTLELKQGQYDKAASAVNLNGTINEVFLQNTLYNNSLILSNAGAQDVIWGEQGIIATDLTNPMFKTRIVGGGIVISEDGGNSWSTGISGKGINASNIKTGQLDVSKIKILNGNDLSFVWDSDGISGFERDKGSYDYSKYTRMDRFGFYAIDGKVDYVPTSEDDIWNDENVLYCLLKRGLRVGTSGNSITLDVSESEPKLVVNGNITAISGKIGNWYIGDNDIQYNDPSSKNNPTICAYISAQRGAKDYLHFGTTTTAIDNSTVFTGFRVDCDGKMYATGAEISGKVTANSGKIGGWNIDSNGDTGTLVYVYTPEKNKPGYGVGIQANGTGSAVFAAGFEVPYGEDPTQIQWGNSNTPFYVTPQGKLYATGAEISGTLKAGSYIGDYLEIKEDGGSLTLAHKQGGGLEFGWYYYTVLKAGTSYGESSIKLYNTNNGAYKDEGWGNRYGIVISPGNNEGYSSGAKYGLLMGNWYVGNLTSAGAIATISDFNKKNSIVDVSDKYEVFFNNLKSRLYKFNDGTSNRYHTGFIAQEVNDSLQLAKIDTKDFGGLVIENNNDKTVSWYLRYEEFISLNTWQIQKLKTRVTDLETEISNLKLQLKNLQNS